MVITLRLSAGSIELLHKALTELAPANEREAADVEELCSVLAEAADEQGVDTWGWT